MKKQSLMDVLLEIQKRHPDAHLHGDRLTIIGDVIENLQRDLKLIGADKAEELMGPYYFLKEDREHINPAFGVWHDEWTGDQPMLLFEDPIFRRQLGRRRGRGR